MSSFLNGALDQNQRIRIGFIRADQNPVVFNRQVIRVPDAPEKKQVMSSVPLSAHLNPSALNLSDKIVHGPANGSPRGIVLVTGRHQQAGSRPQENRFFHITSSIRCVFA